MKKLLFLITTFFCCQLLLGQAPDLDSLVSVLNSKEANDSSYVDLANEIAARYSLEDPKQSAYFINIARTAAQKIGYERGLTRSLTLLGNNHLNVGLPDQALSYYLNAIQINNGQYILDYVRLHNNIGEAYRRKGIYDSSKRYFSKALQLANTHLTDQKPVIIYSNLGEVSLMLDRVEESRDFFKMCLDNALESDHLVGIGYGYFGLAKCFYADKKYDSAVYYQRKAIKVRQKSNHQRGLVQSFLEQGCNYYQLRSDSSLYYWNLTAQYARRNDAFDLLTQSYERLYDYHLHIGEVERAAEMLNKNKAISDSLSSLELQSRIDQIEGSLAAEALVQENQILLEQQERIKANSRLQLILVALIALAAIGLIVYYYKNQRKGKEIQLVKKENEYSEVLLELSALLNRANFDQHEFMKTLLSSARIVLKCDRATYWIYDPESDTTNLKYLDEHEAVIKIPARSFNLEEYRFMEDLFKRSNAVDDLSTSERFANIYEEYFKPAGIRSLLNTSILLDDQFYGFISFSMRYNRVRKWDTQDQNFVSTLKDLMKIAITKSRAFALQEEKAALLSKVQTKNKSLREFNSVISHNLREPLTQIIGFIDLMKNDAKTAEAKDFSKHIGDAAIKIDTVIKELSTVLNEDEPELSSYQEVSLTRITKEVQELLKPQFKKRDVQFHLNLDPDTLVTFKPFLVDAFYHLLSNSLKFSNREDTLNISIGSRQVDAHVEITYADNGWGIDLEKFGEKAFKMYQRYHLKVEGRGIGLFIVKNRISSVGGSISLDSEEGVGTTFTILLPNEQASATS